MTATREPPSFHFRLGLVGLVRLALALLIVTMTSGALANEQEVQHHFQQGVLAEQEGRYERAREHYLAAFELLPNGPVAANLGFVEARLELWTAAAKHLGVALAQDLSAGTRPEVQRAFEQVLTHVGVVDITVSPESATVTVDDRVLRPGPDGLVAYIEPGMINIGASQPGYAPVVVEVPVGAGQRAPVRLLLQSHSPEPEPEPEPQLAPAIDLDLTPRPPPRRVRPEALVAIGGGALTLAAVGLGTGYALAARTSRLDADDVRDSFPDDPTHSYCYQSDDPDCVRLSELVEDETRRVDTAQWSFVAAGGLAVTTVAVALVVRRARKRRGATTLHLHPTPTSISASVAF